jgi:exopolysaccharide biosynthesis polyprenyl glycosylphosphotransferase
VIDDRTGHLRRVTLLLDAAVLTASLVISFFAVRDLYPERAADVVSHLALLPLLFVFHLFFLDRFGANAPPRGASRFDYAWAVLRAVLASVAILLSLLYLLKIRYVSRSVVGTFALLSVIGLTTVRLAIFSWFRKTVLRGGNVQRVLVIGTGPRASHLVELLRDAPGWGIKVFGHLDPDPARIGMEVDGAPVLGCVDDITEILKTHVVDEVIVAVPRAMIPQADRIAFACEEEGVTLRFMADVFDVHVARMRLAEIGGIPLLTMEPVALDEWKLLFKRIFDLVACSLALPFLLLLTGAIAVAIRLDSPGPVFFLQDRVGQHKRRFRMFKFRSMVVGSEAMLKEIEHLNEAEGPIFKITNDPRVTRVGKFLRKTSLDELPQLFNVLRGEMSLVGPRPMSVRDVDLFDRGIQRRRFSVRPGITCIWQVSGRSLLPFEKWLELDLEYIDNWSLGLDLKILLKTIPVVLKGTGAV